MNFKLITLTIWCIFGLGLSQTESQSPSPNDTLSFLDNAYKNLSNNTNITISPLREKTFEELPLRNIDVRFSFKEARVARRKLYLVLALYPEIQLIYNLSEVDILVPWESQSEIQKFQVKCSSCMKTFRNSFYLRLHITRKHLIPERYVHQNQEVFWVTQLCEFISCESGRRDKHEISENGFSKHKNCLLFARKFIRNWKEIPETISNFCIELVYAHKRADPPAEHVSIMKSLFYYFTIVIFVIAAMLFYYYYFSIYLDSKLADNHKNR